MLGYTQIILSFYTQRSHNVCVGIILMARNRFFFKKKEKCSLRPKWSQDGHDLPSQHYEWFFDHVSY